MSRPIQRRGDAHVHGPVPASAEAAPTARPEGWDLPISRLLPTIAARFPAARASLGELAQTFGDRAFGLLLLVLCPPCVLPGMSTIMGVPILILGIQLAMGRRVPRLPGFAARQSVKREDLLRFANRAAPWFQRLERIARPRPGLFTRPEGERMLGWLVIYAAIMLILPGPMTNGPPAMGLIVLALGLIEHDSRLAAIGAALTLAGSLFATVLYLLMGWAALQALGWLF